MMVTQAQSIDDVRQFVTSHEQVWIVAGGTKPALSRDATLDVRPISGVLEYDPTEYTFTALAGTPLREIRDLLAQHGQQMPFDPVLVEHGATLGGTVAAGLSGPGRYRYGGVRDFLLGVRMVNGEGDVVYGGGKVVKNAAGFDIPKLLVGSLGRFGVLVELTFKVFPAPQHAATLRVDFASSEAAFEAMQRLALSPAEVTCLDFEPPSRLWVRVAGQAAANAAHVERVRTLLGGTAEQIDGDDELRVWAEAREFDWVPSDHRLVRIPLLPEQVLPSERLWAERSAGPRRYSVGGNVLWLAWPETADWRPLDEALEQLGRSALVVTGNCQDVQRGQARGGAFAERLAAVFDPRRKFRPAW